MAVEAVSAALVGAAAPRASGPPPPAPAPGPAAPPAPRQAPQAERTRPAAQVDPAPDPQAVQQTTGYVQQLLAAQALGGADVHPARPAHITPERLAAFVDYLESSISARAGAAAVDVTG